MHHSIRKLGSTSSRLFLLVLCTSFGLTTAAPDIDLSASLTASGKGFRIDGVAAGDNSGRSVSIAGDVITTGGIH